MYYGSLAILFNIYAYLAIAGVVVNFITLADCKFGAAVILLVLNLVGESLMVYLSCTFDYIYNGYFLLFIEACIFLSGLILYLVILGLYHATRWLYTKHKNLFILVKKKASGVLKTPKFLRKKTRSEENRANVKRKVT